MTYKEIALRLNSLVHVRASLPEILQLIRCGWLPYDVVEGGKGFADSLFNVSPSK